LQFIENSAIAAAVYVFHIFSNGLIPEPTQSSISQAIPTAPQPSKPLQ